MSPSSVQLIETPRDAFQGIRDFIPTSEKVAHIQMLIDAGFRSIDFGSFVSPQVVPQMRDSEEVLETLKDQAGVKFIAIIVNERGLERAIAAEGVAAVGFPLSISNTFQLRNTHKSIEETWPVVNHLVQRCASQGLEFILYLSMAFGNPYGDAWSLSTVIDCVRRVREMGVRVISLADTTSEANPGQIRALVRSCRERFPSVELGIHLHSDPASWRDKLTAGLDCGIQRIDSAAAGMGGCPFARNEMVGNLPTEGVVEVLESRGVPNGIDRVRLQSCVANARRLMELYGTPHC